MPYNIQFQIAGLFITGLTGLMLGGKKAVRFYTQRTYIALLIAVAISTLVDMLSVLLIVGEGIPELAVQIVCKLYLVTIVCVAYFLFRYAYTEAHRNKKGSRWVWLLSLLPLLTLPVVLVLRPISIYAEGSSVYSYGICVTTTYVICMLYLAVSMGYTIFYTKWLNRQVRHGIWFLMGAWLVAALIQMIHNEWLIVSFAMSLAMIFMYIELENPETYVDNESGALNSYAYSEYLQRELSSGKKLWIAAVHIEGVRFANEQFGLHYGRELLRGVVSALKATGDGHTTVYRTDADSFSVFYSEEKYLLAGVEEIEKRFTRMWTVEEMNFNLDCHVAYLADSGLVSTVDELIDVLHHFSKVEVQ